MIVRTKDFDKPVVQRTHGLCGQMAAADAMVVHDPAEPLRRALAVKMCIRDRFSVF